MANEILNEAKQLWYWLHIGIISVVVLGILQLIQGGNMFNLRNILFSIPLLAAGDIIAHLIMNKT